MFRSVSILAILFGLVPIGYAEAEGSAQLALAAKIEKLSLNRRITNLSPELEKMLYSPLDVYMYNTRDFSIEGCMATIRTYPNTLSASDIIQKFEFDLRKTDLESVQKEIEKSFIFGGDFAMLVFDTIAPYKATVTDRQVKIDKDNSPDVFINSFNENKFSTSYQGRVYFEMHGQESDAIAQLIYDSLIEYKKSYCTPSL